MDGQSLVRLKRISLIIYIYIKIKAIGISEIIII